MNPKHRIRFALPGAAATAAALCAAITFLTLIPLTAASATGRATTGLWTGHGHAVRKADLGLVTIECRYQSEFWFVVREGGLIDGEATVSYDLNFNDAHLRSLITAAHWSTNYSLASIPGVGGLLNGALVTRDLVGMNMRYREFAPVRRGRITGTATAGQLRLQWADPMSPIPYQDSAVYVIGTRPSKVGTHPAYPPWIGDADISEPLPGHLIATTSAESSRHNGGNVTISAIWSAVRQP